MLTFSAVQGPGLRCTGAERPLTVFVPKAAQDKDIVLLSVPAEDPNGAAISWPGEYDCAGVAIRGIGQQEGQLVSFLVTADSYRCAFIPSPVQEWSDTEIEQLGDVAVLMLPAEDAKRVQELVEKIDPRILLLVAGEKGAVDPEVLRTCGAVGKEYVAEYKLKSLPTEGREVVILAN